jgi:hypothetical protein
VLHSIQKNVHHRLANTRLDLLAVFSILKVIKEPSVLVLKMEVGLEHSHVNFLISHQEWRAVAASRHCENEQPKDVLTTASGEVT